MAPLTFGVEFEFLVATLPWHTSDPHPEDPRPVKNIDTFVPIDHKADWARFDEQQVALRTSLSSALNAVNLPARSVNETPPSSPTWEIDDDNSIAPPQGPEGRIYKWRTVEVKTTPYYFTPESLAAVSLGCKTLTSNFRLNVNESCGLHVHVGDGIEGFSLDTLHNLAAFLWTFEPVLETIYPPDRRNGGYSLAMRKCSKLAQQHAWLSRTNPAPEEPFCQSTHSRSLGRFEPADPPVTNLQALSLIYETESINELVQLVMNPISKWMAANFRMQRRPWTGDQRFKRTVEFRAHEGTLDHERVVAWVQTVVGIVEMANEADEVSFMEFVVEHAYKEDEQGKRLGLIELLREVGLDEPAAFYEKAGVYA